MKIKVSTYIVPSVTPDECSAFYSLTSKINKFYCNMHNYFYRLVADDDLYGRHIHYKKIKVILNELPSCDWLFYIDADAFFANYSIKIESLIEKHGDSDIIFTKCPIRNDCEHLQRDLSNYRGSIINAGVILVKNTEESIKFFESVWDTDGRTNMGSECDQDALIQEIHKNLSSEKYKIKLIDPKEMNQFMHPFHKFFNYGDFVCHLAGCENSYRYNFTSAYMDLFYKNL